MIPAEISTLIEKHFDDPEVREVAIYALTRLTLSDMATIATQTGKPTIDGIPAQSVNLMLMYDSDAAMNSFFQQNFAVIKIQLAVDEAKLHSMSIHHKYGIEKKNKEALEIASAMFVQRLDVLTAIAILYKGAKFGRDFDFEMRKYLKIPVEIKKLYATYGVE